MLGNTCWTLLNLRGSERGRKSAQALVASGGGRWSGLIARMFWKAAAHESSPKQEPFSFPFCPPSNKVLLVRVHLLKRQFAWEGTFFVVCPDSFS